MNEYYRGPEVRMSLQASIIREGCLEEGGWTLELELEKSG